MTTDQMNELLEAAKPSVIEGLKNELTRSITWEVKEQAQAAVRAHVQDWVKENIIPEITAQLVEAKDGLVSAGVKLGPLLVDSVVKAMTDAISKKLESTWERKKIFGAMFD